MREYTDTRKEPANNMFIFFLQEIGFAADYGHYEWFVYAILSLNRVARRLLMICKKSSQ